MYHNEISLLNFIPSRALCLTYLPLGYPEEACLIESIAVVTRASGTKIAREKISYKFPLELRTPNVECIDKIFPQL